MQRTLGGAAKHPSARPCLELSKSIDSFCSSRKAKLELHTYTRQFAYGRCKQKGGSFWWCPPQIGLPPPPPQLWSNYHFFLWEFFFALNTLIWKNNWTAPTTQNYHFFYVAPNQPQSIPQILYCNCHYICYQYYHHFINKYSSIFYGFSKKKKQWTY